MPDHRGRSLVVQQPVRTVGIDYPSIGGYKKNGPEVHRLLLGADTWIIEGLDLSGVGPGCHDLICLPLNILQGDGRPREPFARPRRIGCGLDHGR